MTDKIIQIIPAPEDFYAYFKNSDPQDDIEYGPPHLRVVCLALVESSNGERSVKPMTATGIDIDIEWSSNFDYVDFKEN